MQPHLLIQIHKSRTTLHYIDGGDKIHTHEYDYGYEHGIDKHKYLGGILYMLEMINNIDVIPEKYIIEINDSADDNPMRHKYHWYEDQIKKYNYTQFVRSSLCAPHVIINTNDKYKSKNKLGLVV